VAAVSNTMLCGLVSDLVSFASSGSDCQKSKVPELVITQLSAPASKCSRGAVHGGQSDRMTVQENGD
jgi:hypothetical protein